MDRKEIIEAICEWQEADNNKRAVIILTTEVTDKDKEHTGYSLSAGMAGTGENLVATLKGGLKDSPDLVKLIRRAVMELSFESIKTKAYKEAAEIINRKVQEEKK